jgi:hypothetical protein
MFRCLTRAALVVVAGLATTVAGGVPAGAAVHDPVQGNHWKAPECAIGDLTGAHWDANGAVVVSGAAYACGNVVDGSMFGIALYHVDKPEPRPFAVIPNARYFTGHDKRDFDIAAFDGSRKEVVCLVADAEYRLACAVITAHNGSPVTVTPLATDDPLVSRPVKFGLKDPAEPTDPTNACATCF